MRALIQVETDGLTEDQFRKFFSEHSWVPDATLLGDVLKAKGDAILNDIPQDERDVAKKTARFMIYEKKTRLYGLVCAPVNADQKVGAWDIRFLSPDAVRLRIAAEKLYFVASRKGGKAITFSDEVEIKPPGENFVLLKGRVIGTKWTDTLSETCRQKDREFMIAIFLLALSASIAAISHPSMGVIGAGTASLDWLRGTLERFFTATAVTSFVAGVDLWLHYIKLRRDAPIVWYTPEQD